MSLICHDALLKYNIRYFHWNSLRFSAPCLQYLLCHFSQNQNDLSESLPVYPRFSFSSAHWSSTSVKSRKATGELKVFLFTLAMTYCKFFLLLLKFTTLEFLFPWVFSLIVCCGFPLWSFFSCQSFYSKLYEFVYFVSDFYAFV